MASHHKRVAGASCSHPSQRLPRTTDVATQAGQGPQIDLVIVGCGQIGSALARVAASAASVRSIRLVDSRIEKASALAATVANSRVAEDVADAVASGSGSAGSEAIVVVAAQRDQVELAQRGLDSGASVITLEERPDTAEKLFGLGDSAHRLVVGAGLLPGVSDVLVALAAQRLDQVSEVHLSRWGWASWGSANESRWARLREFHSGRELVWFPEPVGRRDCYLAEHAGSMTTGRLLPGVPVYVRLGMANRVDWLKRRRPEMVGLQVEVRGWREGAFDVEVLGVSERGDVACGIVLLSTAEIMARHPGGGAVGLAELATPSEHVRLWTAAGLVVHEFSGAE